MPRLDSYHYSPGAQPSLALPTDHSGDDAVDAPTDAYVAMMMKWELINDLLGGTLAMRSAGKRWLPPEPREQPRAYESRLQRSYLYGALSDTVQKLSAKPFSKPVALTGELPESLQMLVTNSDAKGADLTQFARSLFMDGLKWGVTHVLVDYPSTGGGLNYSEERANNIRPYFSHISPLDLFAWQTATGLDGGDVLTQIRFKERRVKYDDVGYGERMCDFIRVIGLDYWELWEREDDEKHYRKVDDGLHTVGHIPLVSFSTTPTGFMTANPPLEDLAWMNLAHWQSFSDQRNILRFARVGILFASGLSEEEVEGGFSIGPSNMISSTNPDAKLNYVEHSGAAIGAGEKDLRSLEERMEVLGLQPLMQSTGNVTATARAMDEARQHSNIQAWIRGLENTIENAFAHAGQWIGAELSEDFAVDVFNDFGVTLSASEDVKSLTEMVRSGLISHATYLQEVKRRGIIADELDVQNEIEEVEAQIGDSLTAAPEQESDADSE